MKKLYCIPKPEQIDDFLAFSRKYNAGFEYNDFFLPSFLEDPAAVQARIDFYRGLPRDRSEDTLHGAFLDICVNSDDPLIYHASDIRVHQSMDIAASLGVHAVIFHTNHIANFRLESYREGWLSRNEAYWRALLAEYPALSVYLENMFDEEPELLLRLSDSLKDEPRFGVCYDMAHAYLSHTPLLEWNHALATRVSHMHINDNDQTQDTHLPVGTGTLPWDLYRAFLEDCPADRRPSVLIEVRTYHDLIRSVAYMEQHHLYPFP